MSSLVDSSTIFDKLTDHEQYTGAHKHRFDRRGKGRGLAGRDSIQKGAGHANRSAVVNSDGAIHDLSQIVRTGFYGGKQNASSGAVPGAVLLSLFMHTLSDALSASLLFSHCYLTYCLGDATNIIHLPDGSEGTPPSVQRAALLPFTISMRHGFGYDL